jgi:hypothetical protein
MFVKEHIHKFKHLPAKERMKAVAELYHKQKSGMSDMPAKKGKGRPKKGGAMTAAGLDSKGGSIFGDIVPFGHMLGLGLEDKKGGAMTAGKLVRKKKGGSILGDIVPFGHMLGLGLEDKKGGVMTAAGLHKKRGRPSKKGGAMTAAGLDEKGGSIFGDIVPFGHMLGLGLEKGKKTRGRPKKGGAMTAGALPMAHSVGPLHAGSFADMFFKGLTAPFAIASKIPLPGLQQIGQVGTKAFNAIGAPTFF